jgi:mono/diheme cytochrome c family protein
MRRTALVLFSLTLLLSGPAAAQTPRLGTPPDPALLKAWDIDVSPDGAGLPPGHGSVEEGAKLYEAKCAACHGENGVGGPADRLSGGVGTLADAHPIKTVSSYWPYATTLFGFIRASMPITEPRSLSAHEVYALCAYLLSIDGIVPKNAVLDAKSLPNIVMPNRHGFKNMWNKEKENAR